MATDVLVGMCFHLVKDGKVSRQGQILSRVQDQYLVELYDWNTGKVAYKEVISLDDINKGDYVLYDTIKEMQEALDKWENTLAKDD